MKKSCGIVIVNERDEILLGLVTMGRGRMDIPKGLLNENEAPIDCAIRECFEETGFLFKKEMMTDLGEFSYMPSKMLHLFKVSIHSNDLDLGLFNCTSFFNFKPKSSPIEKEFPEISGVSWVPIANMASVTSKNLFNVLSKVVA